MLDKDDHMYTCCKKITGAGMDNKSCVEQWVGWGERSQDSIQVRVLDMWESVVQAENLFLLRCCNKSTNILRGGLALCFQLNQWLMFFCVKYLQIFVEKACQGAKKSAIVTFFRSNGIRVYPKTPGGEKETKSG